MTEQQWIKPPVEIRYAEELKALKENDTGPRPQNWQLSPKAVRTFIPVSYTHLTLPTKA